MTEFHPKCTGCQQPLPEEHTVIAMRLHICPCGHETEVSAREATEYLGRLLVEIEQLRAQLRAVSPFGGIDL